MRNDKQQAVMFLGASRFDKGAYLLLKKMGIAIVMTDMAHECPQFQYADEYFVISASDVNAAIHCFYQSRFRHQILMAYCGNDFGVRSALAINSLIAGYTAIESDVDDLNDKSWMKSVFEPAGVVVPKAGCFFAGDDPSSVRNIVENKFSYPIVIKPTNASGARGVSVCRKPVDFLSCWETAISEGENIFVEEFIDGAHLDLNGFMVDGVFYRSGSSDRYFLPEPRRIMLKNYAPSILCDNTLDKAWKSLQLAATVQGLKFGPIKADFIVNSAGAPYLLETAMRFHGGLTTCGSMAVSGTSFSVPEMTCVIDAELKSRFERSWTPSGKVGTVHIFPGLQSCNAINYSIPKNLQGIESVFVREVNTLDGSTKKLRDNRDIRGYLVAYGESREECDFHVASALLQIKGEAC